MSNLLNVPVSDEKIHVYLFKEGEQFYDFIRQKYPSFPDRRAFFFGNRHKAFGVRVLGRSGGGGFAARSLSTAISTRWCKTCRFGWTKESRNIARFTHGTHGYHPSHISDLNKLAAEGRWQPDIRRLESFRSPAEMTEIDYGESWAWVHWLLETDPARKQLFQGYIADLRRTGHHRHPCRST